MKENTTGSTDNNNVLVIFEGTALSILASPSRSNRRQETFLFQYLNKSKLRDHYCWNSVHRTSSFSFLKWKQIAWHRCFILIKPGYFYSLKYVLLPWMERVNMPRQKSQSQTKTLKMPPPMKSPFPCPPPLLYVSDMLSVAMHVTLHLQSLFNIAKEKGNTWVFQLYFCYARILWREKWPTAMPSWVGGMLEIWQASIVKSFKFLCKYTAFYIKLIYGLSLISIFAKTRDMFYSIYT